MSEPDLLPVPRTPTPLTPGEPADSALTGDQVLHALSQIERQLHDLRRVREEQAQAERQVAGRIAEIIRRESDVESRSSTIESQRATLESERSSIDTARAQLDQRIADLESRAKELEHRSADLNEQTRTFDARESLLRTRLEEAERRWADLASAISAAEVREKTLADLDAALTQREAALAKSAQEAAAHDLHAADARSELSRKEAEILGRSAAMDQREDELRTRETHLGEREEQLKNSPAPASAPENADDEWWRTGKVAPSDADRAQAMQLRYARLARYKRLLRDRAGQLLQAKQAIETRFAEIEPTKQQVANASQALAAERESFAAQRQVLEAERSSLAAAHQQLEQSQRAAEQRTGGAPAGHDPALQRAQQQLAADRAALQRERLSLEAAAHVVAKRDAARSSGLLVASAGVTLVALGALSWFAAGFVAEPVYLASVTLAAENPNDELGNEQLAAWQRTIAEMPGDPQLLDLAAERYRQRGMVALAHTGGLELRLNTDLDADTSEPGTVKFTLRGPGRARTARELETLAAACVSHANELRSTRRDGVPTLVTAASKADSEPIDDPRLIVFAGMMGGLSLFSLLAGVGAWRGLVGKRRRFETEMTRVENADDPEWGTADDLRTDPDQSRGFSSARG